MTSDRQLNDLLTRCQYKYKDLSKRDILATLSYFKELGTNIEKYTYPNGQTKDLVTLNGTIPVNYKNNRYNIPIQLYLADTHPYTPPLCYVRPTPDMSINVSETVDSNGKISLSCLKEWQHPNSDLYVLLNLMTIKFSEQTPLYSKVNRSSTNQSSSNTTSTSSSANLPYPSDLRPTYPTAGVNNYSTSNVTNPGSTPYPTSFSGSIPYPINNTSFPYPSYANSNGGAQSTPYPVTNNPYYPMPQTQPPPTLTYLKSGNQNNIGQARPSSANLSSPYPNFNQTQTAQSASYSDDTIKPEHFKMSLITAIQDKARLRYFELESVKQAEIDSLKRVNQDLQNGENELNQFLNESESEVFNLTNITIELKRKTTQFTEKINQIQHRDKADIEDAVVTPTPLYRQLMQLFAEELAIQDLIYYLSEGLQNKTISLENFLKQVRILSRKQFMLRATMQKAREKAALPL